VNSSPSSPFMSFRKSPVSLIMGVVLIFSPLFMPSRVSFKRQRHCFTGLTSSVWCQRGVAVYSPGRNLLSLVGDICLNVLLTSFPAAIPLPSPRAFFLRNDFAPNCSVLILPLTPFFSYFLICGAPFQDSSVLRQTDKPIV